MTTAALALDPPSNVSVAGVATKIGATLRDAKRVVPAIGVADALARADEACARIVAPREGCTLPDDERCATELVALFAKLQEVRPTLSARRAAACDALASDVFDAASRLALARDAVARGTCDSIAAVGTHPSHMVLGADQRMLLVRPLAALRADRRYAVVAQGIDVTALPQLKKSIVPKPAVAGITVPPGAFTQQLQEDLGGDANISIPKATEFFAQLEREASAMPGLAPFAGVRVTLAKPVRPEDVGKLQLGFVPAGHAPPERTVAVFEVLDARAGLLEDRARLATLACDAPVAEPQDAKTILSAPSPHVARVLHGRYRSLDVSAAPSVGGSPLGIPAAQASPIELSYLLALPEKVGPETPLVLLVDGHFGSAQRLLGKYAGILTDRGMAVMAVDLPLHGERVVDGKNFLDALDPVGLGRNVRQGAVDVLAAIRTATRCGLALPDGERLRFPEVRFLGYSLGAMVGAIVRSVEPALGTSVLAAAGGDILGWLLLRIAPEVGAQYVTCLAGADEGQSCMPTGRCTPPGECIVDPYFDRLHWLLTVPFELVAAPGDPLSYVTHRTGASGKGRLLMITGGDDPALHPALATRLADAFGMRVLTEHERRGPRSQLVQWPELGHDLIDRRGVRWQAADFLASNGHRLRPTKDPLAGSTAE